MPDKFWEKSPNFMKFGWVTKKSLSKIYQGGRCFSREVFCPPDWLGLIENFIFCAVLQTEYENIRADNLKFLYSFRIPLREKCPNMELFLVRIFLHSDWIWRFTYGDFRNKSPYSIRIHSVFGHYSGSACNGNQSVVSRIVSKILGSKHKSRSNLRSRKRVINVWKKAKSLKQIMAPPPALKSRELLQV